MIATTLKITFLTVNNMPVKRARDYLCRLCMINAQNSSTRSSLDFILTFLQIFHNISFLGLQFRYLIIMSTNFHPGKNNFPIYFNLCLYNRNSMRPAFRGWALCDTLGPKFSDRQEHPCHGIHPPSQMSLSRLCPSLFYCLLPTFTNPVFFRIH